MGPWSGQEFDMGDGTAARQYENTLRPHLKPRPHPRPHLPPRLHPRRPVSAQPP